MSKNGELEIEKDVPIPRPSHGGRLGQISVALRKLKVGDSVFIPGKRTTELSGYLSNSGLTGKCTSRAAKDGVRVWRIK